MQWDTNWIRTAIGLFFNKIAKHPDSAIIVVVLFVFFVPVLEAERSRFENNVVMINWNVLDVCSKFSGLLVH